MVDQAQPAFCSGCGRTLGDCPTAGACRGAFEPPRYCQRCGRRMSVQVTPTTWRARCRDHGELRSAG